MGDFNQLLWIRKNSNLVKGSIIELGSKFYQKNTNINFRAEFLNSHYVGIDLQEGENVDIVCDITKDFDELPKNVTKTKFQTIICCSVMEHVKDIFKAAENISRLTDTGGVLFISVPFIWEFHGYPSDYWRFTPEAVRYLFKDFDFDLLGENTISSNTDNDMQKLSRDPNDFLYKNELYQFQQDIKNPVLRKLKRVLHFFGNKHFRKEYLLRQVLKKEKRFPYTSINLVGVKK